MRTVSRREFVVMAGATVAASKLVRAQQGKITAGEIVNRIKKATEENTGEPWGDKSVRDTFKFGGPDTPVTGIATSFGGNFRVLDIASKAGMNMVIVHEPTYYSDFDVIDWVKNDPVYKWKLDWATKHNTVVWRIHDHWHAHKPDGIRTGMDNAIGWNDYKIAGSKNQYKIPQTTVLGLAKYVATTLKSRSVRVMGDPNLPVTVVAHGGHQPEENMASMQLPGVDCLLISETKEYDSFEYVRDAIANGSKKGAIFISHMTGEDEGMHYFADWLKPIVPEVPIQFVPTTDEFWNV